MGENGRKGERATRSSKRLLKVFPSFPDDYRSASLSGITRLSIFPVRLSRDVAKYFRNLSAARAHAMTTIEDVPSARTRRGRAISKCHSNSRKTRRFEILFSLYCIGEATAMHFYGCIREVS